MDYEHHKSTHLNGSAKKAILPFPSKGNKNYNHSSLRRYYCFIIVKSLLVYQNNLIKLNS